MVIPLPTHPLQALKKRTQTSKLIFPAAKGGPERHSLRVLKDIALWAGVDPDECGLHKFRKSLCDSPTRERCVGQDDPEAAGPLIARNNAGVSGSCGRAERRDSESRGRNVHGVCVASSRKWTLRKCSENISWMRASDEGALPLNENVTPSHAEQRPLSIGSPSSDTISRCGFFMRPPESLIYPKR